MFPPRLNDGTVHEAKVCVVRVAYETNATGYGDYMKDWQASAVALNLPIYENQQ